MTAAGAQLLPGFDLVSAWLNLEARLLAADLVITESNLQHDMASR